MSLLNDALRNVEQRRGQGQPAPSAYVQARSDGPRPAGARRLLPWGLAALGLLLAGGGLFYGLASPGQQVTEALPVASVAAAPLAQSLPAGSEEPSVPPPKPVEAAAEPGPVVRAPASAEQPTPLAIAPVTEPVITEPLVAVTLEAPAVTSTVSASSPPVRQQGSASMQAQPLTQARAYLLQGLPEQALAVLTPAQTAADPAARLLRARALLALEQPAAALAALQQRLPAVAEHPEYHVTLATLLQQQGRPAEAALLWAELLAWNDAIPGWWIGLAIALEGEQRRDSALRAYQQAVLLPGLDAALENWARTRIAALRAG
ncbi:MAG: hypothetical protein LAT63_15975 [Marinobacter sp.]|nr:hypothetical protein [Marinobacter sp.]